MDKYDSYYKQSVWFQAGAILDFFLLTSLTAHLLVELSGVVAENIRILSFAINQASYKDIIGLRTFYHVVNSELSSNYCISLSSNSEIYPPLFQQQDKAVPPVATATVISTCRYFKLGWNTANQIAEVSQPVV